MIARHEALMELAKIKAHHTAEARAPSLPPVKPAPEPVAQTWGEWIAARLFNYGGTAAIMFGVGYIAGAVLKAL